MKILHIIPNDNFISDGISLYCNDFAQNLNKIDIKSDILTIKNKGSFFSFWAVVNFFKIFKKYDFIHFHSLWQPYYLPMMYLLKVNKRKYIITCHGNLLPGAILFNKTKKMIYLNLLLRQFMLEAGAIVTSSSLEYYSIEKFLKYSSNLHLMRNGVDLGKYVCKNKQKYDHSNFSILYVGRISAEKGIIEFINSLSTFDFSKVNRKLSLVVAGPKNNSNYFNSFAKLIGGINSRYFNVKYIGEIDYLEKIEELYRCDLLVLPSFTENFGATVAEAILSGRMALTTNKTQWVEYDTEGGIVCVEPTEQGFHAGLNKVLNLSHEERYMLAKRSILEIKKKNNWSLIAKYYENKVLL